MHTTCQPLHTYIHIHAYIHTYIHPSIHPSIHSSIHAYISEGVKSFKRTNLPEVVFFCTVSKVKGRDEWMKHMNLKPPSSWSLQKKKQYIMQQLVARLVRAAEEAVLQAVDFSGALLGSSKVELSPELDSYTATFEFDCEMVIKKFPTLAKANDWLVGRSLAFKKGGLHKTQRQSEMLAKPEVAFDRAANQLLAKDIHLTEVVCSMLDEGAPLQGKHVEDVTSTILTMVKCQGASLPTTQTCVHRGSYNSFMTVGSTTPNLSAVLLGKEGWNKKFHACQLVLTTDPPERLLDDARISAKCTNAGLTPCGYYVSGPTETWRERCRSMLGKLLVPFPMMVCFDYSTSSTPEIYAWELDTDSEDNNSEIRMVTLSWATQARDQDKKLIYNMCWHCDLGVSILERTTEKVCGVIMSQVENSVPNEKPRTQRAAVMFARLVKIIPDGYCGWHALRAGQDLEQYERRPRNESGYPLNRRLLQEEEAAAKDLHWNVCCQALDLCDPAFHSAILRVQSNPSFSPHDLEWIAQTTGLSIRCTCSHKARTCEIIHYMYSIRLKIYSIYIY